MHRLAAAMQVPLGAAPVAGAWIVNLKRIPSVSLELGGRADGSFFSQRSRNK